MIRRGSTRVWLLIGVVKTLAGAVAWCVLTLAPVPTSSAVLPPVFDLALMTVFVCTGLALVVGAREDGPSRALGAVFVFFGSIFADPLLARVAPFAPGLVPALRLLHAMQPVALTPAFFWQFAWEFPRPQPGLIAPSVARAIRKISYVTGVALFVVLLAHAALTPTPAAPSDWARGALRDAMWVTLVLLSMPTMALLLAKLRTALPEERRRLRLFIGGILLGSAPLFLNILANAFVPGFRAFATDPAHGLLLAKITAVAILLLPATTAYAVVVDRVLETRFIVRLAIQYAFTRYTVLVAMAIPALVLVSYLYKQRHRPLAELWSASPLTWVALLAAVALIGWLRAPILRTIDRRFFREQHNAREILVSLTESTRRATSLEQTVSLVRTEIDRAFHVQDVAVLVRRHDAFVDPTSAVAPLPVSTTLATLAGGAPLPLDVETSDPRSPLARLPESEREWLAGVRARLIVPLLAGGGALIGLLALGDKRSEAPYSFEDRELLKVVAAAAGAALEQQLRQSSPASNIAAHIIEMIQRSADDPGRECPRCQLLLKSSAEICEQCGGSLSVAPIPKTLCGKFAVERRIGSGGMGLVYLARDTSLNRLVAVKTLHRLSPEESRRLRREARALATLQHQNLEIIYAVETWRGTPVLVLEYLAGGTLSDRLRKGPLAVAEATKVGIRMAEALHSLHRAGVLHCDIKPSNVGFTGQGVPKLLDFGLAAAASARYDTASPPLHLSAGDATTHTDSGVPPVSFGTHAAGPAGTLIYMSPEAIDGAMPDVSFDLWSLAVTLYEALAGSNPFAARDRLETIRLIKAGASPDLSSQRPDCPPALSECMSRALSADIRRRPATAREFGTLLSRALVESGVSVSSGRGHGLHF